MDQAAGVSVVMQQKAPRREHWLSNHGFETVSSGQATQQHVDWDMKWGSADNGYYDSQIRKEWKDSGRNVENH